MTRSQNVPPSRRKKNVSSSSEHEREADAEDPASGRRRGSIEIAGPTSLTAETSQPRSMVGRPVERRRQDVLRCG